MLAGALTPVAWGSQAHACLCRWEDPGWMLGPALTHGVTALLHGPNGAPSLHAAAQSPTLLQILKRQRPQGQNWSPGRDGRGSGGPSGVGAGMGRVCVQNTHAVARGEDWLEEVVQEAIQVP